MKLADLLSECRTRLDDVAAPLLWSDDDLTLYANEAEREACERAKLIEDDSLAKVVTLTSLTQVAGVATANKVAHGFLNGQRVRVAGADQAGYNLELIVSVPNPDTFTFSVDPATVSPASGGLLTGTLVAGTITNIAGLAGVGTYPLDSRIIEIRSALWNGGFLSPIARETLNDPRATEISLGAALRSYFNFPTWDGARDWSTLTGTPRYYIDPQEKYLTLVRIPTVAAAVHLSVYRRPLADMRLAFRNIDEPEIGRAHHIHLIEWMEHLAYNKRDADAHDPKLAEEKGELFTAKFGARPDANVRRQQRAHRSNQVRMNPSW